MGDLTRESWIQFTRLRPIKHLMTVPKGNTEFCFPETLNASLKVKPEMNIEVEGKQNSLFSLRNQSVRFTKLLTNSFEVHLKFSKFTANLAISLRSCQSNRELGNEVVNFTLNFVGKVTSSL